MNTHIPISVFPEAVRAGDSLVRIDVKIQSAPEDLFGAAFHLKIGGAQWSLKKFEAGDVFGSDAGVETQMGVSASTPLILAEERLGKDGVKEIIFGTSLKRTDEVNVQDGTLVSFYLQMEGGAMLQLSFSDTRLSVLSEARNDIANVVFEDKTVNVGDLSTVVGDFSLTGAQLQANLLNSSPEGGESQYFPEIGQVYGVMSFCLILLLFSTVSYFLYRRWKRVKERD